MSAFDRQSQLCRLANEEFDLLIIGGGITGACLAYDAASRGLRTALVERSDFGQATSSSSSKLLHGGIRFLQQLRFDKVRESAFERVYFQNLAPHLCRYVPFLVPTFPSFRSGKSLLAAGAAAYTVISAGQNRRALRAETKVPLPSLIKRSEVISMIPWLGAGWDGTGALVLPECHMKNSERMTLAMICAASDRGAVAVNYVRAEAISASKNRVRTVSVVTDDGSHITIRTNALANCAGPWLGRIDRMATDAASSPISSFFRGSHLILQGVPLECALALPTPQKIQGVTSRGGRHVFMIPWRDHVILGTSYAPHDADIDDVAPTDGDKEQLLDAVNSALGSRLLSETNVVHAFAGLYPITAASVENDQYQGASDYVFLDHGRQAGPSGYFSVFGAKFTTARKLAEIACNEIARQMSRPTGPCITRDTTLRIADVDDPASFCADLAHRYATHTNRNTIDHLFESYGTDLTRILEIASAEPELFEPISNNRATIAAEAIFCARHEMLVHLDDFIFRRTGLGTIGSPGRAAITHCAALIARELGWSSDRREQELEAAMSKFPYAQRDAA